MGTHVSKASGSTAGGSSGNKTEYKGDISFEDMMKLADEKN